MTVQWTRKPRFNHVAMSVPSELLEPAGRKQLVDFYGDVIADDAPMTCPRLDHYGIAVYSEDDFRGILDRAKAYRARDDRVDIIDEKVDDHGMLSITSCYIRYLLPMMVEVQWWQFAEPKPDGAGA
jgi:hypothetical protein